MASHGSNPFDQNHGSQPGLGAGAWGNSEVQTTFMPHEATVPAVPGAGPTQPGFASAPGPRLEGSQVPAVPQQAPGAFRMPFTNSTAVPSASGNIGRGPPGAGSGPSNPAQGPPQPPGPGRDTQPLLQTDRPKDDHSKYAFYNIRKYRPYFDVDTNEVLWRVANSLIGAFRADFMSKTQESPDLYGPFWIATTLIFVTAVSGNYAQYIEWRKTQHTSPPPSLIPPELMPPPAGPAEAPQWFNDYTKLGASAGIFYGYTFGLSLILWLVMRYLRSDMMLVNMFCVYGYAMTIFIPVSLICIIPVELLRWLLVMGCTLTSGLFLLMNLRERIMPAGAGKAVPMLIVVLLLHFALGLALKLYFFQY